MHEQLATAEGMCHALQFAEDTLPGSILGDGLQQAESVQAFLLGMGKG